MTRGRIYGLTDRQVEGFNSLVRTVRQMAQALGIGLTDPEDTRNVGERNWQYVQVTDAAIDADGFYAAAWLLNLATEGEDPEQQQAVKLKFLDPAAVPLVDDIYLAQQVGADEETGVGIFVVGKTGGGCFFAELIDFNDSTTWTQYGWKRITPATSGDWTDGDVIGTIAAHVRIRGVQDGDTVAAREKQSIAIIGATAGTFTLTYSGQTTSALAYNCSAGDIETALEALSNLTSVTVTGSGTYASPFVVEFLDSFSDLSLMTATPTLTPSAATNPAYEINNQTVKPGTRVVMYRGFGEDPTDYRFAAPMLACPGTEILGYVAGRTNVLTLNSSGCFECIQTSNEACP